jgi:predicted RNase H-like HicB family nuclease
MTARYLVMIYRSGGNYSAMVPDLPGCVAAAKSVESIRKMMTKAIAMHLELMHQSGEKIPKPRKRIELSADEAAEVEFCTWVEVDMPEPVSS